MKDENKEKRGREWANSIFKVWTIFKAPTIWGRIWADVIRGSVAELFSRVCPRFALPARADRKCLASDQKILAVARSNQIRIWKKKIFASWSAVMTIMSDNHERCFGLPISFLKLKVSRPKQRLRRNVTTEYHHQCDQKKIAKCLSKLHKNDFTRKMIDFDTFTKIA